MRSCGLAFIGSSETLFFILSLLRLPLIHMLINKLRFIAVDRATFNRFPSIPRTNLMLRFCWSSQRIILDEIIREKRCFYDFHGKISNVVMINSTRDRNRIQLEIPKSNIKQSTREENNKITALWKNFEENYY